MVSLEHRDRVLDWRIELQRLEPELPSLPPAARRAVDAVGVVSDRTRTSAGEELADVLGSQAVVVAIDGKIDEGTVRDVEKRFAQARQCPSASRARPCAGCYRRQFGFVLT